MDKNAISFIERVYQDITNQKPKYKYSGKYGNNSTFSGNSCAYNLGVLARLVKIAGHDDIELLELETNLPACLPEPLVSVKTKINFLDEPKIRNIEEQYNFVMKLKAEGPKNVKSVSEKINDAIKTQKTARTLIEEKEQTIRDAVYVATKLGSKGRVNYPLDELKLSFQPSNSKKPLIEITNHGFKATARGIDDLPLLLKPLEYQIENLESANKS
jgi:hypothetical protein